jgi:magnesium-transporting ATPase (P-type)
MEDVLLAITAFILQLFLQLLLAAKRPWKYVLSVEYRQKLNSEWSGRSRIVFYSYVFYGFVLFALSIFIIAYVIYLFFFMPEPEPTSLEQLKSKFTEIAIEAINDAR